MQHEGTNYEGDIMQILIFAEKLLVSIPSIDEIDRSCVFLADHSRAVTL